MSKNCQDMQSQFPGYLTGELETNAIETLQKHVTACTACRSELEELTSIWTQLGILPEEQPGPNLRKNFYTMLESYQQGLETRPLKKLFDFFKIKRPVFQWAFAVVVLLVGFAVGYFFQFYSQGNREIQLLRRENQMFRQQLAVEMLKQPSPSQRLKGLIWTSRMEEPGDELLTALLHTLNNDPNINVRLSAVDALYLFAHHPMVKQGLTESLQKQTSPMVQIALIDLLVEMREKQAAKSLKQLLEKNKLTPEVKERAKLSLQML